MSNSKKVVKITPLYSNPIGKIERHSSQLFIQNSFPFGQVDLLKGINGFVNLYQEKTLLYLPKKDDSKFSTKHENEKAMTH
jgi:hypothetical protein